MKLTIPNSPLYSSRKICSEISIGSKSKSFEKPIRKKSIEVTSKNNYKN